MHEQIEASPARQRKAVESAADTARCEDALQPAAERGQRHGLHRTGHAQKPQGNIGKDNPNNDPSEINFHRT